MGHTKQYTSFAAGAFGHDMFYATLSTYLMLFVTSQLFDTSDAAFNARMISYVTIMMMVIRLIEIAFDPLIGGMVDNTNSKWGKFKPWLLIGAGVSSVMLIIIFTNFGGLTTKNPVLYLILFGISFVILDIFYSFKDIAFWSMLPALSVDSKVRGKFGTIGRFGSTLGAQSVPIFIFPLIIFLSKTFSGSTGEEKTRAGWLGFAIVVAVVSFLGALATAFGTKEEKNIIREDTQKTRFRDVFKVIAQNDQLMWLALSYFLFALSYVVTNSLMAYYFQYVLGNTSAFSMVGVITAILGIISVSLFPTVVALIKRRAIYVGGIAMMLLGYLLFIFAGQNVIMVLISVAIFFFPYPMIFLAALMTITDSVEYGQLKNGTRNESVTLSVRPLIDKLAGAIANGVVALAAVHAGMIGSAKPSSISSGELLTFKTYMFYTPIVLIIIAALVYLLKVSLTEKKHAEVVNDLEKKLTAKKEA
ncbi:galactose cation symporter [Paucilactobacillus oligofermentans DSM 15707 = LMG 22743]|uniref:Galactose cation symporter n=1 Tax=Paucilactobacillus oligofermentans DSM 15707 = LMG 22743 TaxID=1423778 RepID=A0A0R1RL35_9LACO|nr:glycoside-pentoside-hexuronide (GPH):cation symporter [Paucilactobacillus oligofermentans]KRL55418.1 galactose cation symporter [Paucilactobacillus oligofermentans DSM 15707 = LMG 22743]CUS25592.1 Lactose permease [Paucilactobacillus oligofermentans DSM 15707 = LMG 22743]